MTDQEMALIAAVSAVVHYQEFLATNYQGDLSAAESAIASPHLKQWMADNEALIPVKRDPA